MGVEQPQLLLAIYRDNTRNSVKQLLKRGGYRVLGESVEGNHALNTARNLGPDLVLVEADLPGISGFELARILADEKVAPVLLIAQEVFLFSRPVAMKDRPDFPLGYVSLPLTENSLFPAIENMLNFAACYRRMEGDIRNLREKLETRKIVEKAKGILMEQLGITEGEAYRRIQKQSMDKCLTMRKVAEAIILTSELK